MTFTPIPDGTTNWGSVLNASLNDIQSQISNNQLAALTGDYTPEDNGLIAWSFDVYAASGSSGTASGVMQLVQVSVKKAVSVNSILLPKSADSITPVAGQNFVGLYDSSGNRLAVSADITTALNTGGATPVDVTIPTTPIQPGKYWVAILQNAATPATFLRGATGLGSWIHSKTTSSTRRLGTFGAALTALPSSFTPSSMTATFVTFMVAIA